MVILARLAVGRTGPGPSTRTGGNTAERKAPSRCSNHQPRCNSVDRPNFIQRSGQGGITFNDNLECSCYVIITYK
jgi:hypothetical protein